MTGVFRKYPRRDCWLLEESEIVLEWRSDALSRRRGRKWRKLWKGSLRRRSLIMTRRSCDGALGWSWWSCGWWGAPCSFWQPSPCGRQNKSKELGDPENRIGTTPFFCCSEHHHYHRPMIWSSSTPSSFIPHSNQSKGYGSGKLWKLGPVIPIVKFPYPFSWNWFLAWKFYSFPEKQNQSMGWCLFN